MVLNLLYQTDCLNISQAWSDKHEIHDRDQVLRIYHGWLNLPPLAFALPLTCLFMIASVRAIKSHRVSRKFHALLVNRAIGDLAACLVSLLIIFYVFIADHVNTNWIQLLNTFFTACFWSGLVTYTSIGFLKLYGIARPLQYKDMVTMRSWLFFLLIVAATMGVTLIVKIQVLADWTGCKVETCLSWNVFTLGLYLATLICFAISVSLIRKAKRRSTRLQAGRSERQQRSVRTRFKFPLIKLTLGVSTFAFFHLPYAVFMAALMMANGCYFVRHYNAMQSLLGIIRVFVLLRIILDSILGFTMDQEVRRQLLLMFSLRRIRIGESGTGEKQAGMKLSTTTNSVVITSESAPDSYESGIVEDAENSGQQRDEGSQRRTESAKSTAKGSSQRERGEIQPKRHSDRTDYNTKRVKF